MLLPLLFVGCNSIALVDYRIDGSASTTIAGTRMPVQLTGEAGDGLLADSMANAPQVDDGDLAEAHFEALDLSGVDADDSLEFLTSVEVSVAAPGLDDAVVARAAGPFDGPGPFALTLLDVDLAPYLVTGEMSFPVELAGVTPAADTDVAVDWTVVLGVTAQGAQHALASQSDD
jgi:hypothetical protein